MLVAVFDISLADLKLDFLAFHTISLHFHAFPCIPSLCIELERKKPRSKPTTTSKKELIRWNLATLSLAGSFTNTSPAPKYSQDAACIDMSQLIKTNRVLEWLDCSWLRLACLEGLKLNGMTCNDLRYAPNPRATKAFCSPEAATHVATDRAMRRRIPIIFQRDDLVQTVPAKFCQTLNVSRFRES